MPNHLLQVRKGRHYDLSTLTNGFMPNAPKMTSHYYNSMVFMLKISITEQNLKNLFWDIFKFFSDSLLKISYNLENSLRLSP
jgi:hypothetical protein